MLNIQCASKMPTGMPIFQVISARQWRMIREKRRFCDCNGFQGDAPWAIAKWTHNLSSPYSYILHSSNNPESFGEDPSSSSQELVTHRSTTKKIKNKETRNAWQIRAYGPLGAVVSPPSKCLWNTLIYWSPECLCRFLPSRPKTYRNSLRDFCG